MFKEMESIIEQMMNVARYQQWDTVELEPVSRLKEECHVRNV
jgi:hypothetical protein